MRQVEAAATSALTRFTLFRCLRVHTTTGMTAVTTVTEVTTVASVTVVTTVAGVTVQ